MYSDKLKNYFTRSYIIRSYLFFIEIPRVSRKKCALFIFVLMLDLRLIKVKEFLFEIYLYLYILFFEVLCV